ncbi:MAG: SDR family NAD(P)-dependent oxidoreductase [Deltaproteobacteria bacterium]|nr:SDR family NAD(P)-dependent oxidoreductase [Deltaproteobacteria bacterium]
MTKIEKQTGVQGMVILVTGGSGDIGSEICRLLSKQGARVVVHYHTASIRAKKLAQEIDGFLVQADLSQEKEVNSMVEKIADEVGPVEGLINCAGFPINKETQTFWDAPFEKNTATMFEKVFAVDCIGVVLACQKVLPVMKKKRFGRIVNLVSTPAVTRHDKGYPFTAAKAALLALTKSFALEVAPFQVTANAIALGTIDTHWMDLYGETERAKARRRIPIGRIGTPADVAAAASFLVSREAGYITGQTIVVDGGDISH